MLRHVAVPRGIGGIPHLPAAACRARHELFVVLFQQPYPVSTGRRNAFESFLLDEFLRRLFDRRIRASSQNRLGRHSSMGLDYWVRGSLEHDLRRELLVMLVAALPGLVAFLTYGAIEAPDSGGYISYAEQLRSGNLPT